MVRKSLVVELKPTQFEVVVDTREQRPLDLVVPYKGKPTPLRVVRRGLRTGDYSVSGLEHLVCIERKSIDDLAACITVHRDRFVRELERTMPIKTVVLVVEASWSQIELKQYHSQVEPNAIIGSLYAWRERYGFSLEMAGNRANAAMIVARTLYTSAREHYGQARPFWEPFLEKLSLKIAAGGC